MSDLLTPAELAAIAEREAKATPPVVYFINSPDTGFDEYPTLKEALDAAEETISNYRDEAIDGWNEEVTSIRVGIITHDVEQFDVKHRKDCGEDENWACPNCDETCDYRMSSDGDLLALLNVARADRAALLRHIAALEARTPAPALQPTGHSEFLSEGCFPEAPLEVQPGANFKPTRDLDAVLPPAPATDVNALLAEAENAVAHEQRWLEAQKPERDLIARLATALRESRAREVAAEKKYQRLFEPWDEVNGWCEHNHQFSYRLDDEDNSDGCMQCERDAAIARAEKAESEAKEANSTLDMYAKAWWRELKGPYRNKRHEIDALVLTTRERISDLAAARAELGALGPVEGLNMPYGVIRVRRVLEGGAQ